MEWVFSWWWMRQPHTSSLIPARFDVLARATNFICIGSRFDCFCVCHSVCMGVCVRAYVSACFCDVLMSALWLINIRSTIHPNVSKTIGLGSFASIWDPCRVFRLNEYLIRFLKYLSFAVIDALLRDKPYPQPHANQRQVSVRFALNGLGNGHECWCRGRCSWSMLLLWIFQNWTHIKLMTLSLGFCYVDVFSISSSIA